ncbi:cytochrome P450 [Mollisia scopiformis]|uniref:Cytochrome P450 n=1 Tax=Mollisia scopiformis TaxID=149040 RepID=A0A194XKI7_MOLSC|nr:cytochrome P450 [Mollisia scopiformis]KUJ20673.1 cytochrome P450 [Mollisia scopiformis]
MSSKQGLLTFTTLFILSGLLVTAYLATLVIYRVFFHPLAKYPGPFIAKVTDLYSVYHAWKADRHIDFQRCHQKYGNVFRYGPNRLSFNTQTALQTINSAKANTRKADFYKSLITPTGPSILSAISDDVHARKKRVLSQCFSDRAMKSAEDYTLFHIRKFCEKLATSTEAVDMSKWTTYLTGDVLGELCFGSSFNMLTETKNRFLMDLINLTARFALVCGSTIPLQHTPIPKLFFSDLLAGRLEFRSYALAQATERTKIKDSERRDFYHYLMEAKNPDTNERFDEREIWSEAGNLIVAGTDTTSTTLASTFFYFTRNPDVLERAKKEVREVFKDCDIEDIRTGEKLSSCKYLRACLDESMRMSPPLPGILARVVLPGGIMINSHVIPAGVEVGVAPYALHHNEQYHKDSFVYNPERFLDKGIVEGWAPFSYGPRACIGKAMAYMEMMCTMARVLKMFDLKGVGSLGERVDGMGGKAEEYRIEDFFVCHKFGPMVEFSKA